jgi:hypothetical protein
VATIRLYVIALSNPAAAAAAMLAHKGISHRVVHVPTVPALELDGRKVQGTLEISRALDELRPDPPLFPRTFAACRNCSTASTGCWPTESSAAPHPTRRTSRSSPACVCCSSSRT